MEFLRNSFIEYFTEKGYIIVPSSGLKAENANLLFNISGGVIFEDHIEGFNEKSLKLASIQRCLRTDSWKKIGSSGKHHIFFEMLGHFSFYVSDSYETKLSFIKDATDFLLEIVNLPRDRIYLTIHPDDPESIQVVETLSLDFVKNKDNISLSPQKRRSGYRVEIKWRRLQREDIELWNLVFTQYEDEKFEKKMTKIAADSGMSLERLLAAREDKNNDYECSFWNEYVDIFRGHSVIPNEHLFRMADLLRSSIELFKDGFYPGKKSHNYVSRKIMRELFALMTLYQIDIDRVVPFTNFPQEYIREYYLFLAALKKGEVYIKNVKTKKQHLENQDINILFESYGYPELLYSRIS
jgi:alanyl-tRNA synthetase